MTGKIKRRSLRCGGRPKADFGSIFTTFIAPALGVAGSVADSAISKTQVSKSNTKPAVKETNTEVTNNNTSVENLPTIQVPTKEPISGLVTSNTVIPPDPTKTPAMRLGGRKKCWIGTAIMGATSIAGSLFGAAAQKREMRRQKNIQDWQNTTQEAANMTTALNNSQDYQEDYLRQFRTAARLGKTLGAKGIYITDGGDATKIGNNTYLLLGGSHEDVNETGQTGIGINVGGNEVEAEGGEVAQKKNGALRIFSAQPILGNGMSPAQAILRGYNKDKVFSQQQAFKKRNGLKDDGSKAKHGTEVPYKRIHINEDGTFTDTLTGKNYNTSATNGEDVVITGKANHWKEAGKKDTSSYFDPMGAINFVTAAGAPILNANPSNVVGSIRDSKNFNDFVRHYMMQDTGGFVNTKWAKEHPYLSLGINTIGDIGLGIGANKAVDILRHPLEYGKYGYKLNKLYKKAGLLNRGEYKTSQENYEKLLDYYLGNRPYDEGAIDYAYDVKVRDNAERLNPDMFYSYVTPNKVERANFRRVYAKKATDDAFTEMHTPIRYGFNKGIIADYDDLMNHNPEYYKFLEETNLPWNEQSTVDAFLKRQETSLRGVYADDKETAKKYFTEIQAKRKGGDRLNTNGGLYSSNSTGIADAFKNPDNGVSNGYIGKLHYDFGINRDKPIADQLRQARMKIVRGGKNNVFAGTKYYKESIENARKQGAVAIEDNYGRSNGDVLNVTERAYLPGSAKQDKLTLQNLKEYLAQENQRGRWNTSGVDKMKEDEELFIPRQYNRFDDFIREARIFMKPRREYDFNKVSKFQNDVIDRIRSRSKYRNKLIDKSRRLLRRNERNSDNFDIDNTIPIMDFDEPFRFGGLITMPFADIAKDVVDYFSNSNKYTPKRVKVSNKTVNRKPIRNGQVGNFRVVNGKYFPNEKPLRQVYPEFDIISMGRGLPIKRSLKNTVGFVQKPNTFTRGIGNREGIKDLIESKVVRGNPVGTEMTAEAYTKATKFNRNSFNDIMNGTGREGISHRYYNRSLSKEDFDAIRESYNKINASFKARHTKASSKIRFGISDDIYDPLGNYKNYDDYLAQISSDRKTLRNATTINPDNGEPIAYFYNDGRNPLTQGHDYASSKWGVRISNPQDYNMKIFNGHLHYSNSKTIPFDSPNVEVFRSTPFGTIRYPKWMLRRGWYRNGGLTSKDRGSSKHPYPSVSSKDFAGGGRSYPIPTKADAVDALRLAGLHGRSDVRSKVYSKYPSLRKKSLLGSSNRPIKGMRAKAAIGIYTPFNKRYTSIYDAPDYDSDYNGGNVLGNGEVTVTAKRIKPTFMKPNNDAMNIINHPANETPYIPQRHNRSRTIFSGGDYLGLGIDTLAALSTGLVNYNTAGKYTLPDRAPIIQASKLPTTYNVNPEIEEVKRYRDRLTGQTFNNTSSSVAALNRSSSINLDALSNLSKLWATKENEENKMLTEDAKNQQTVAAQNVQNELARQSEIARIKNEATQAKGDALNVGLSGLSQAWTNFWTAGRTAYEDDQSRRAMIASSKEATPTRLSEMDFDLSPDILASLYRTAKDDRTKRFYLSRLSPKQRQKYGIN